jgi:glycosyltransferase involved in cell wall biosynthesis
MIYVNAQWSNSNRAVVRDTGVLVEESSVVAARRAGPASVRRRRIAVYVPALVGGGAERVAAVLASGLAVAGHETTLVVDFEAPQNNNFVDPKVEQVTLAGAHAADVARLAGFIAERRPDIALAVGASTNVKLVLAHLLARTRSRAPTKIILSYHGSSTIGRGRLGWSAYPLAPLLTRYAARTVTVSDVLTAHLVDDWRGAPAHIVRIHNPVPIDRAKPAADEAALMARSPVVLALGRLSAEKDFPTLIAAMARMERNDARLVICGDGPERETLQKIARCLGFAQRLELRGYIADPWSAFAEARCFALSSTSEAFGNVVVEALASGLPVVATDCGGPGEILDSGRFGTLVPIGDAAALGAAIARALDRPGDPSARIARARAFSTERIVARYLALFESVLSAD